MMAQVHSQTTEDFQGAQRHGQGLPPLGFLQGKNAPKNEGGFIAHRRRLHEKGRILGQNLQSSISNHSSNSGMPAIRPARMEDRPLLSYQPSFNSR